jgi:poly-gamma-glutamate synthesis protein (capsule biosynthesis protein)
MVLQLNKIHLLKKQVPQVLIFLLIASALAFFFSCLNTSSDFSKNNKAGSTMNSLPVLQNQFDTITISAVGDLMCHSQETEVAKTATGYDYSKFYSYIKPYINQADIAFGNLETVTAGADAGFTGYPAFNSPVEYLDALKDAGFDVLTNVNNHSLDRRIIGVEKTIDALDARGLMHTGTYKLPEDKSNILVVEAKGIKIAVLGYTFSTNGIPFPKGKEYCVNMIDKDSIRRDVMLAKKTGADKILVSIHWGEEYERSPNNFQKDIADFMVQQGVDIILGSHPHVLQPIEMRNEQNKQSLIIYSLGNFISYQRKRYTDCGVILRIQLIKNRQTNITSFGKIDFVPTYVSLNGGFRILSVMDELNKIKRNEPVAASQYEMNRLKEVWEETSLQLTNNKNNILPVSN